MFPHWQDYVRSLSEQMQVVYYRPHGHYESHYDSESDVRFVVLDPFF